jgi:molybdopterin biosynthesis enzyme
MPVRGSSAAPGLQPDNAPANVPVNKTAMMAGIAVTAERRETIRHPWGNRIAAQFASNDQYCQ